MSYLSEFNKIDPKMPGLFCHKLQLTMRIFYVYNTGLIFKSLFLVNLIITSLLAEGGVLMA